MAEKTHAPIVVILGHNAVTRLGLARMLDAAGCRIHILTLLKHHGPRHTLDRRSRCIESIHRFLYRHKEKAIAALLETGKKCSGKGYGKPILLPDSDFSVALIEQYREVLAPWFQMPSILDAAGNAVPGGILGWMDKIRQKNQAVEMGLNVAQGRIVDIHNGDFVLPEGLKYPCFIKPLASISGGKHGLKRCDDEQALRKMLQECFAPIGDTRVLVEEYKNITHEYALVGLATPRAIYQPGVFDLETLSSGSHKGVAKKGIVLPPSGRFLSLMQRCAELIRATGYHGLYDIDLYEADGELYFGEINFRSGASSSALGKAGINLPALWVRSLRGEDLPDSRETVLREPVRYHNERVCLDDWLKRYTTTKQLMEEISDRDKGFVYDPSDPLPWQDFLRQIRWLRLTRCLLHRDHTGGVV